MHYLTAMSLMATVKRHGNPVLFQKDTLPAVRNTLAERFLSGKETKAEWALLIDSDMFIPFKGGGGFFTSRARAKVNPALYDVDTIERLLSHGKKIVGAVYNTRTKDGPICIAADLKTGHKSGAERELIVKLRKGPFDKLIEQPFVATGCVLVHRSVFEDIAKGQPEGFNGWFDINPKAGGEDVQFCQRALKAGHKSHIDCGLFVGHVGNYCYLP
jgi:hypothetical protein